MTNEERDSMLHKIYDAVIELVPTVADLKKTVYGNGTPGLKQHVAILAEREENCPAKAAHAERWVDANDKRGSKMQVIAALSLIVSTLSAITAACVAVFK